MGSHQVIDLLANIKLECFYKVHKMYVHKGPKLVDSKISLGRAFVQEII